jgi:hypothetical protein
MGQQVVRVQVDLLVPVPRELQAERPVPTEQTVLPEPAAHLAPAERQELMEQTGVQALAVQVDLPEQAQQALPVELQEPQVRMVLLVLVVLTVQTDLPVQVGHLVHRGRVELQVLLVVQEHQDQVALLEQPALQDHREQVDRLAPVAPQAPLVVRVQVVAQVQAGLLVQMGLPAVAGLLEPAVSMEVQGPVGRVGLPAPVVLLVLVALMQFHTHGKVLGLPVLVTI